MAVTSLNDLLEGQDVSTDAETESSSDDEHEIPGVFEEIGADMERVEEFYSRRDESDREGLLGLAERLSEDDEAWQILEDYRLVVDAHRINLNFVRGQREGPFVEDWSHALYYGPDGSKDSPAEGSKNDLQTRVGEDDDLNLPWYKVMFPEPVSRFHEEDLVRFSEGLDKWSEIGMPGDSDRQDSHIFVTESFVNDYASYANEDGLPLPPADYPDDATATDSPSTDSPSVDAGDFDPAEFNVDVLKDEIEAFDSVDELSTVLAVEQQGKDRKTAKEAIRSRIAEVV